MQYNTAMGWVIVLSVLFMPPFLLLLSFAGYHLTGIWALPCLGGGTFALWFRLNWIIKRVFPLNEQDHLRELAKIMLKQKQQRVPISKGPPKVDNSKP